MTFELVAKKLRGILSSSEYVDFLSILLPSVEIAAENFDKACTERYGTRARNLIQAFNESIPKR